MGVLVIRALLYEVYIRVPDFGKLPYGIIDAGCPASTGLRGRRIVLCAFNKP